LLDQKDLMQQVFLDLVERVDGLLEVEVVVFTPLKVLVPVMVVHGMALH
tara:strand:+ start:470 stop:616 length:147 start_codon:yes stop_codon:yes gene_type:complete